MNKLFLVLALAGACQGSIINVTSEHFVDMMPGDQLAVHFSATSYGLNNPGFSPYPTWFSFTLLATAPNNHPDFSFVDSQSYYTGYSMSGTAESVDGSFSFPLGNHNLLQGSFSGPITVAATVFMPHMTLAEAMSFYDAEFEAVVVLTNTGRELTMGFSEDRAMGDSTVFEIGVGGAGPVQAGAQVRGGVYLIPAASVPEPGTFVTAGATILVLLVRFFKAKQKLFAW